MAEFAVNTTKLESCSTRMAALQRELDAVAVKLGAMQLGSVLQIKASTALIGKIGDCKWAAAHQSDNLGDLAKGLNEIAELYAKCEKNLADPKTETQAAAINGSGGSTADEDDVAELFKKLRELFDLDFCDIAGAGAGGISVVLGIKRMLDGTTEQVLGGYKNVVYGVGEFLSQTAGSSAGDDLLKALLGQAAKNNVGDDIVNLLLGSTEVADQTWSKAFDAFTDSHFLSNVPLGADKVDAVKTGLNNASTVCKWATYLLSGIINGYQNYKEFDGDMINLRFWGETLIQTGVDIGLSGVATVGAAALLSGTAPAVAVFAVGAAAVWAGNTVCEWITGESIAENVADVVCDGIKAAVDVVGDAADAVGAAWSGIYDRDGSW